MRIRLAKPEDCRAIAQLHRDTIKYVNSKDYPPDVIKHWAKNTTTEKHRKGLALSKKWVALIGNKIVGYTDHNKKGEYWGLYVHKNFHGRGIGKKLITTCEASLKKMGIKKITIESSITAKGFYERMGYKVIKKIKHKMGEAMMDVYEMVKKIT